MIVNIVIFYISQRIFGLDVLFYKFYFIMGGLMYFVINCYVLPKRLPEHLFVYWMIAIYILTIHSISAIIQNFFSVETENIIRLIAQNILFLIISVISSPIVKRLNDITINRF